MPDIEEGPANLCLTCKGEGTVDGDFDIDCLGTGFRISVGLNIFLKQLYDDVTNKCDDIKEVVDEIKEVVDVL